MAKNTGRGYREGEVRDRSQVYNPVTKTWTSVTQGRANSLGAKRRRPVQRSPQRALKVDSPPVRRRGRRSTAIDANLHPLN